MSDYTFNMGPLRSAIHIQLHTHNATRLAVPFFLVPGVVLVLGAMVTGIGISVAIGTFKKYL